MLNKFERAIINRESTDTGNIGLKTKKKTNETKSTTLKTYREATQIPPSIGWTHSRLITGFVPRLTRWAPLVEQQLLILPEHLSSPPVFSGVCVTRSLVLYVCFIDRCLSFCTFSFGHYGLLRLRFLITPFLSSNSTQSRHFYFATPRTMNGCSIIFVCACWYSEPSMMLQRKQMMSIPIHYMNSCELHNFSC